MSRLLFPIDQFPDDDQVYLFMVRSDNFLGKGIRFFMWLKQVLLRKQTKHIFNHADLYVMQNTIAGAQRKGIQVRSIHATYCDGRKRTIRMYKVALTPEEITKLRYWVLDQSGKPYEIANFIHHIYRILYLAFKGKEKWIGRTRDFALRKFYCSEFASTAITKFKRDFSLSPWDDDPMDLYELAEEKLIFIKEIRL